MKKGILCKVVLSALLIGQMNLFNTQVAFASENTTEESIEVINSNSRETTIGYVKTNGISLNVRKSASTSSSVLGSLSNGSKVTIVETVNGWYKIKYGSGYGYISSSYVSLSGVSSISSVGYVKTNGAALNVRRNASTSSSVLGSLSNGAQVEIVETLSGWYKIKYGSNYGYVSSSYISMTQGNTNTTTQTAYIKTSGSSLNVRESASTNSSILGSLSNGTQVEIVETLNGWYKIKYGSGYGYVSSSYVSMTQGNTSTTTQTAYIKTSGSSLNVRKNASTSSSILGSLSNGTQITIVETLSGWYKIKYGSGYGYVSSSYVSFTAPTTSNADIDTSRVGYVLANFNHSAYYNNGSSWGQCVWYVKGRAKEKLGHSVWSIMGNANQWYSLARNAGAPTSSNVNDVRSNSILCRSGGSTGYGHIVYIEHVDNSSPEKWVYYTESNVGGTNGALKKLSFSQFKTKVATGNFQGYIYLQ